MVRFDKRGRVRPLTKAPHDRFITPAWILSVLVFITLPFVCSATTGAKYTLAATTGVSARAAKWDPFARVTQTELAQDAGTGYSSILVFPNPGQTTIRAKVGGGLPVLTLRNNSEVAARYVFDVDVATFDTVKYATKQAFLAAITFGSNYDPTNGIVLACGATATVTVSIPAVTFTGLKITAYAEQVD